MLQLLNNVQRNLWKHSFSTLILVNAGPDLSRIPFNNYIIRFVLGPVQNTLQLIINVPWKLEVLTLLIRCFQKLELLRFILKRGRLIVHSHNPPITTPHLNLHSMGYKTASLLLCHLYIDDLLERFKCVQMLFRVLTFHLHHLWILLFAGYLYIASHLDSVVCRLPIHWTCRKYPTIHQPLAKYNKQLFYYLLNFIII